MPKQTKQTTRKKPVQERSRETVGVILEAAARVLEKKGLAGYNTNAIAECAGVSVGSLYQYFANKDALTLALIENFERELMDKVRLAAAEARGKPLRTSLTLLVRSLLESHHNRAELNRLLEIEEARLRRPSSQSRSSHEYRKIVASFLVEHRKELGVPIDDSTVEDMTTITRAMVDAALLNNRPRPAAERRILRGLEGYLR